MEKDDINPWSNDLRIVNANPNLIKQVNQFYQIVEKEGQEQAHLWLETLPEETRQTVFNAALANQVNLLTSRFGLEHPSKRIIAMTLLRYGNIDITIGEQDSTEQD